MSRELQNDNVVITDTSCFILLDKIDAILILNQLYVSVITTPEIVVEFGKKLPDWIEIRVVINKDIQNIYSKKVDPGEASAIALAIEMESPLLILDDLKGRKLASSLNLRYTGTLGLLIIAKKRGVILSLKPYFDKIKSTDFRVSPILLQQILKDSGE